MFGKKGKNAVAGQVTQILAGTNLHLTSGSEVLPLDGASMTVDQTKAQLQAFLANRQAVVTAEATLASKIQAEDAQAPALLALVTAYVTLLKLRLGSTSPALADFGIPLPRRPLPLTAEQKAVAAAKRQATRKARKVMGSRQRLAVVADVAASLVVTPMVTVPAAPAPAPAPAPATATATATGGRS